MLLGVAGMIGSGKTTLAHALASRFGLQLALESVDDENPWLERFYGGGPEAMRSCGMHLQLHFLATRFAAMRRMRSMGGSWILDRTWYEDAEVFARGLYDSGYMSVDDWKLYQQLYSELLFAPAARPPRLLLYLHGPLDVILDRIATRGRSLERDAEPGYFANLHARYEHWIGTFRKCPVIKLDVRKYDLFTDPAGAAEEIAARVRSELEGEIPQTELWPGIKRPDADDQLEAR